MKITPQDFGTLQDAILPLLNAPNSCNLWKNYQAKGLTEKRFVWDLLWASKVNTNAMYKYLNDDNITTALIKICKTHLRHGM